jgi:hypothetical protein
MSATSERSRYSENRKEYSKLSELSSKVYILEHNVEASKRFGPPQSDSLNPKNG